MKTLVTLVLAATLAACGGSPTQSATPAAATKARAPGWALKIGLTTVYVDDQAKALRFYTEVLGFSKKTDITKGPFRWLTVIAPGDPEGTELQLALNDNPAAKAYQEALFQHSQPAVMFYTDDVKGAFDRITRQGAAFTMPPTDVTGSTIAILNDTCGNLVQLTQLTW